MNDPQVQQSPVAVVDKPWTLKRLAELNRYDIIGKMLDRYRIHLDLDDYDSEHGNRFRDACRIVRELCKMEGVPLSLDEQKQMQASCTHSWERLPMVWKCEKCEAYANKDTPESDLPSIGMAP